MAIQKPEWFKIDATKFLADAQVDAMSTVELGACFRLLCRQWIDGSIPDDLHLLGRLCRLDATSMGEAWITLSPFFPVLESGKRANRFMWIEREKIVAALERKSDEGTRAARKRWNEVRKRLDATPIGSPMPDPMQDQTRPEQTRPEKNSLSELNGSSDVVADLSKEKATKEPSKDANKLAALLKAEILKNKADCKITHKQERSWAVTAERMLRLDGRSQERIADVIRWAQHDEFEMSNVLSMDKLRKRFDQLELKRGRSSGNGHAGATRLPVAGSAVENTLALLKGGVQ